jgi:hypothetical protein
MPDEYVTDTHGLYWYLTASTKLGVNARAIFGRADVDARLRRYMQCSGIFLLLFWRLS